MKAVEELRKTLHPKLQAVLEKRGGISAVSSSDVYVNVTGGLRLDEPAADAAGALALYSGLCDRVIPEGVAVFGEIGLGGEMRGAAHAGERIRECKRMGFDTCIVPKSALSALRKEDCEGIRVIGASNLTQLFKAAEKCINDKNCK